MENMQIANPAGPVEDGQLEQFDTKRQQRFVIHPKRSHSFTFLVGVTVIALLAVTWGLWGVEDNGPTVRKTVLNDDKASAIETLVQEDKRNTFFLFGVIFVAMLLSFAWLILCMQNNQEFRNDAANEVSDLKSEIQEIQLKKVSDENEALVRDKENLEDEKTKIQAEKVELQKLNMELKQELVGTKFELNGQKEANTTAAQARESMMRAADEARERHQAELRQSQQEAQQAQARAQKLEEKSGCLIQ